MNYYQNPYTGEFQKLSLTCKWPRSFFELFFIPFFFFFLISVWFLSFFLNQFYSKLSFPFLKNKKNKKSKLLFFFSFSIITRRMCLVFTGKYCIICLLCWLLSSLAKSEKGRSESSLFSNARHLYHRTRTNITDFQLDSLKEDQFLYTPIRFLFDSKQGIHIKVNFW